MQNKDIEEIKETLQEYDHYYSDYATDEDCILIPTYKGLNYKYHECSNCKGKTYFEEDICYPFHFEEKIKYCPFCGNKIIRYAKPRYIELPNWDWLKDFEEIIGKTYRYLEYKIHCKMNNEEIKELIDKSEYGEAYFGKDNYLLSNGYMCNLINNIAKNKLHYSTIKKLKFEFDRGVE